MADKPTPVTIKLEDSVTYNNKTYDSITFNRKMIGKDMLVGDAVQGNLQKQMAIIASMAGVPLPVITDLTNDDIEAVMEAAVPFMGKRAEAMAERVKKAQEAKLVEGL